MRRDHAARRVSYSGTWVSHLHIEIIPREKGIKRKKRENTLKQGGGKKKDEEEEEGEEKMKEQTDQTSIESNTVSIQASQLLLFIPNTPLP